MLDLDRGIEPEPNASLQNTNALTTERRQP